MMTFRLVRVVCVFAILLAAGECSAQSAYHQLTVADFQGVPPYNSGGVIAYTNCSIDFRYQAQHQRNYYRLYFNIQLRLNTNKSWIDKSKVTDDQMLAEILRHEQGHYTIAYMEQQELLRAVSKTVFQADYQQVAANIFNRIDAKYKQLNYDYDEDTGHMTNRAQQLSWNAYFKKRLDYMPESD
jgi:hypothetical protein